MPICMTTLSEALNHLYKEGIQQEFKLFEKGFSLDQVNFYQPDELCIIRTYRFESMSDPSDTSIIFVIKVLETDQLGFCLDAFGVYSNNDISFHEFLRLIKVCREDRE